MNISDFKGVKEILKRKDRSAKRLEAFDNFIQLESKDRIHGLGIKTGLKWADLDVLEIGFNKLKGHPENVFSDQKIIILEGEDILNSKLEGINTILDHIGGFDKKDRIDSLHEAVNNLTLVYIPSNSVFDSVMLDKFLSNNSFNHTLFYFGKNSKVNLLYHITSDPGDFVGTEYLNVLCDTNSTVFFGFIKDLGKGYYLHNRNFNVVLEGADLNFLTGDFGGRLIVNDTVTRIIGKNSNANTDNLFYGTNSEEFDISGSSIHANSHTSSLLTLKGVLEDSRALTRGLVKIEDNAPNSNGYQKSDILLLDDKSKAVSIPDLLIHNDQVKCSHGSTISHLEEDKVFYLQSRGLGKKDAMRKLVEGFYHPVFDKIPSEIIKEKFVEKIESRIYVK